MSTNASDFKEFEKQLKKISQSVKELGKTQSIPLNELFTSSFMRKYTSFSSFDELMEAGGFHAETEEEFEAIPDDVFDKHISSTTKFKSWENMFGEAVMQYTSKKLGF